MSILMWYSVIVPQSKSEIVREIIKRMFINSVPKYADTETSIILKGYRTIVDGENVEQLFLTPAAYTEFQPALSRYNAVVSGLPDSDHIITYFDNGRPYNP